MAHILVVDDSFVDRRLAQGLIRREPNWTVSTAANGHEALEHIEADSPDLVLTDLQMPDMDGLELVRRITADHPLIPVILMTGAGSETVAVEALQQGAASYVPKTELAVDLVPTIGRILSAIAEERHRRRLQHHLCEVRYLLTNDLQLISAFVAEVRALLGQRTPIDEGQALRLANAVDEALTNAYYHGNLEVSSELRENDANSYHDLARQRRAVAPYKDRMIDVRLGVSADQMRVTIRDDGPGFDVDALPDPTAPGYLERPSGRGVLLMRSFMDRVEFNDRGNQVTMVKHFDAT